MILIFVIFNLLFIFHFIFINLFFLLSYIFIFFNIYFHIYFLLILIKSFYYFKLGEFVPTRNFKGHVKVDKKVKR